MATYVAFLRGMNLGRRRLSNDRLREAFVAIGFDGATPYQASGNVIVDGGSRDATELRRTIEAGLADVLGYDVPTVVRSADDVARIAAARPFDDDDLAATTDTGRVQVGLLHDPPGAEAQTAVLAHATAEDRLMIDGRELYWLPRDGIAASGIDVTALGELHLGGITVRTHGTVQRLAGRLPGG